MAKPSTLPRWATDLSNNTAPSSGQMDTGWTANQTAVSSYFNYLGYWTYQWLSYFDAGIWQDDLEIQGTLKVTGAVDLDTTLNVDGASTLAGGIANNVALTLGATVASNQHITLQGTGDLKHGSRSYAIAGLTSINPTGTYSAVVAADVVVQRLSASGVVYIPITGLRTGDRFEKLIVQGYTTSEPTFAFYKQNSGVTTLLPHTPGGGYTMVTNGFVDLFLDTEYTITDPGAAGADQIYLKVTAGAGAVLDVRMLTIGYEHP